MPISDARGMGSGFLSGVMVVFVGNVVARGLGFLFPLALARVTSRSDFALVYFFVNTGFAAGELVLAGFPTGLTRFISAYPGERSHWTGAAVLGGMPLLTLSIIAGCVLSVQSSAPVGPMILVIVGLTIDAYYFALLRGLGWFGTLMLYRISANAGQLIVLLVAAALGFASVELAVAAYSLLYLAPIVVIELKRHPLQDVLLNGSRPTLQAVRALTRFSVPALVSGLAYAAIQGLDVYFVRAFAPAQLADYGAARSLAMPMQLVPFAITLILLPRVASASEEARARMLEEALSVTLVVSVAAVLAYALLAGPLVSFFFPAGYKHASGLLVLIAPAMGIVSLYSVLSQWWMGIGRSMTPAACLVVAAALAACAELVITPRAGAPGAAASMGIGGLAALALLGSLTLAHLRRSSPGVVEASR
jgi:O-antigen/teichoic acid export membrane protein